MDFSPSIFKAYDIRGIYPSDFNEKAAYSIGKSFVSFLGVSHPRIAVGRDNRLSSPSLFKALTKGIADNGGTVVRIGVSTTPMLYWTVANYKYDGGINVTASHNPAQYNGLKIVGKNASPISETTGLKEIKEGCFKEFPLRKGKLATKEIISPYCRDVRKGFDLKKLKPLRIVIDTANATAGIIFPRVLVGTPLRVKYLFKKLDGSFPNHLPNPLVEENLSVLKAEVVKVKADLGVAFDGDGDRIFFTDETGKKVPADVITALLAEILLKKFPGEKIIYDLRSTNAVPEVIRRLKGVPIPSRIGHSFIKEQMEKQNAIFGGELSGHYFLRENYFFEAPFFILFSILQELTETGKSFSELLKPYQKYFHSGEINFEIENKEEAMKRLEEMFKNGKTSHLDGIRIDFNDWWFCVRPSNTEPVLRLVIEAKTEELLEEKRKTLVEALS